MGFYNLLEKKKKPSRKKVWKMDSRRAAMTTRPFTIMPRCNGFGTQSSSSADLAPSD